jgi:hypothetical protein
MKKQAAIDAAAAEQGNGQAAPFQNGHQNGDGASEPEPPTVGEATNPRMAPIHTDDRD